MLFIEFFTYAHLIGFALGFGGAMVSDAIFFSSIKDKIITNTEYRFMKLGSRLVWIGLAVLFASGVVLVLLQPDLLTNAKFLTKMVIVSVIVCNGIIFHYVHMPHLISHIHIPLYTSHTFRQRSHFLTMSGGVSVISWFSAALLGSISSVPYSFIYLLAVYAVLLLSAVLGGITINYLLFRRS
jgi:hypothetical protein